MDVQTSLQRAMVADVLAAIEVTAGTFAALLEPLTEVQMNSIPFAGSWTPAQLAIHVLKANNSMAQALEMFGRATARKPDRKIAALRKQLLDTGRKWQAPAFIRPGPGPYERLSILRAVKKSDDYFMACAAAADPFEAIDLPSLFGDVTKLELFHFVLYHTQRHIQQLNTMLACI